MEELYENLYGANVTIISNEFLSQYLSDTKPEYIKVFLFYLWKGIKEKFTISEASNEIDLDEEVVEMALKYWIRKKLIRKECLIKERVETKKQEENTEIEKNVPEVSNLINFQDKKQELIKKNRKCYDEVEKNLLFVAEKLLGQELSGKQAELIEKCYKEYNFNEGLIQYLIEYCSNKNKKDSRYMGRIAESWYEQGIKNANEAKQYTDSFENSKSNSLNSKSKKNIKPINRNIDYDKMFSEDAANIS